MARIMKSRSITEVLPDLVINMIMCLLSTKLAARSSLICKEWASFWSSITVLNFEEYDHHQHEHGDRVRRKTFMAFLRRCLKCRDKVASIEKLRFRMTFLGGEKIINKWISFALEKNVRELDISFIQFPIHGTRCRHYIFPWAVFDCARSLTLLKLEYMTLKDNFTPISLPCLKTLALDKVKLMSNLVFSHLISSCPSLETISLASCGKWDVVLKSLTLKSLKICSCNIKMMVEAPNLEAFKLIGQNFRFEKMNIENFNIASCRKLKSLEFIRSNFAKGWFEGLNSRFSLLESLIIHHCTLKESIKVVSQSLQRFAFCDFGWKMEPFFLDAPNLKEAIIVHKYHSHLFTSFPIQWLIGNFNACEKMNLRLINDQAEIIPGNIICSPPLPRVRLLEVEISAPLTEQVKELEESLRWMAPKLEWLSITHK